MTGGPRSRVAIASLSPLAIALSKRPVAELSRDARLGSPATLRARARRYEQAAAELLASGHEDIGTILDVFAGTARRVADAIDGRRAVPRHAPWLRLAGGAR